MRGLLPLNRHISIFTSQSFCTPKRFHTSQCILKDATTVTDALSLAERSRSSILGSQVHGHIVKLGLSNDVFCQNSLIKMYSYCGVFSNARKLFDEMPERNLVSWTLIISGANKNGEYRVAMESFTDMIRTGYFLPNEFALGSIMKACISMGALEFGLCIHCLSVKVGLENNVFVGSSIMNMYSEHGGIEAAESLFKSLNCSDLGCWNAMIGSYAQCGYGIEAINTVSSMHSKGVIMDEFTFVHALNACSITSDLDFGTQIHGMIIQNGLDSSVTLMNSLIDMYFKTGAKYHAWRLFKTMEHKDIVSWNTVLSGSYQAAGIARAVPYFTDFMATGLNPNHITLSILFRMCGDALEIDLGLQLYSLALRLGFHGEIHMSNSLIRMFCRCGAKQTARSIFDSLPSRNLQDWNEMIHGYNLSSDLEALKLFTKLWGSSFESDECTFSCAVEACFKTENLQVAKELHGIIIKSGYSSNGYVCSSLIHGYAKSGCLTDSYGFFDDKMDAVCWGALISALVEQGYTTTAIKSLNHLKADGQNSDSFILVTQVLLIWAVGYSSQLLQITIWILPRIITVAWLIYCQEMDVWKKRSV